jgi:hypothetical protein
MPMNVLMQYSKGYKTIFYLKIKIGILFSLINDKGYRERFLKKLYRFQNRVQKIARQNNDNLEKKSTDDTSKIKENK